MRPAKERQPGGLEYDLTQAFAQELGVGDQYLVAEPDDLESQLGKSRYHLAAAWLSPRTDSDNQATPAIFQTRDILAQHEATLPLTELSQLATARRSARNGRIAPGRDAGKLKKRLPG